ncbi:MAG: protein kinase [Bryobacter sp.]|nr:protein kinase [Bryobacter sp. CoA8 C33]
MTSGQWQSISPVLYEAMALAPKSRLLFVEEKFTNRRDLLNFTQYILRRLQNVQDVAPIPDVIAGWSVLIPLGSDGMFMDYLVEREDQSINHVMTFKVAQTKLEDPATKQQFQQEIRALSSLYDANIARLLDNGWVEPGCPFVVTEFEAGPTVTEMSPRLDLKENLTVFLRILTAIGYAHQRRILHGDLRPSNILLTKDRVPRLLNFGLARTLARDGDSLAAQNEIDADSISYLSPEQIRGKALTEASDVYTLGVVFYEMLAGRPPYGQAKDSIMDRGRAICESIPPRVEAVDEELNYIISKALQKTVEGRYPSVLKFRQDIEAYLEGRGVMPRQEHFAEFLVRSVKGNWVTAALLLAVIGVGWFAYFQRGNQYDNSAKLRSITGSLLDPNDAKSSASASAGNSTVQGAKLYLDEMLGNSSSRPELWGELARAYVKLAEIEFRGNGQLPGNRAAAIESTRKAFELTLKLVGLEGATDLEMVELARSAEMLAKLLQEARDYPEALKVTQELKNKLNSSNSASEEVQKALAVAESRLADLMFVSGEQQASMPFARSAVRQFGAIFEADRGNPDKARAYVEAANNAGGKALELNLLSEAMGLFRLAESTIRPKVAESNNSASMMLELAKALTGLGEVLAESNLEQQARMSFKEARQLLEQALAKDKDNGELMFALADVLLRNARLSRTAGDLNIAFRDAERSIQLLKKLLGRPISTSDQQRQLSVALTLRGEVARQQKNRQLAQESFEEAHKSWNVYGRLSGLRKDEEVEIERLKSMMKR